MNGHRSVNEWHLWDFRLLRFWVAFLVPILAWTGLAAPPETGVRLLQRTPLPQGVRVVLSIAEPEVELTKAPDGQTYSKLALKGAGTENQFGQPSLPLVHYACEVPPGVKVAVTAHERNHREFKVAHPVWPHQKPVSKQPGAPREFQVDASSYFAAKSADFQKAWNGELVVTPYRKRGQDYVDIFARPFAYHAQKGVVRYAQEVVLDLAYTAPELPKAAGPRMGQLVTLEMVLRGKEDLEWLDREGYNFERRGGNRVEIYATEAEAQALKDAGFSLKEVTEPPAPASASPKASSDGSGYHNYASLTAELQQYHSSHTNLCRLISIGQSVQGRDLWAMKITESPDLEQGKPRVRLTSTLHGDEPLGTEICLSLIDLLLSGSQTDARLSNLVATTEIWILPLLNPDGLENGSRFNAGGYDLNRSFPDGGGGGLGNPLFGPLLSVAGRPPEVASLMRFSAARTFALAANFHAGALLVNYPYDDDDIGAVDSPSPDDGLFEAIAREYSAHNPSMWASGQFSQGIVNGAAWYVISGGMQDWQYRYLGCNEVTIELSESKRPSPTSLSQYWADNREAILSYIETVHAGVQGRIVDESTGQPLYAALKPLGIEHPVFTDPAQGDYHRMLLPGSYHLLFTAPGYETRIVSNVVVQAGLATRVDVALEPAGRQPERIILVTCESLRAGSQALVAWKEAEGFRVQEIVVPDGTSEGRVRAAIRDVYSIFPAEYILLIGDAQQIPCFNESPRSSDLPYALIDAGESAADYLGKDAILGRIALTSSGALNEYVQKLAAFARSRTNRLRDLTWVSQGSSITEEGHDWCITNALPPNYQNTHFRENTGSADELTARINAGTDGVIYSGHGKLGYWVWNYYDASHLAGLSNFAHVPIVIGHCCYSGGFFGFGERWLQTAARAVAYVGATGETYWFEDDCLQKGEFQAMKETAGLSIGKALEYGLQRVHEDHYTIADVYFAAYRIQGDPTLVMLDTVPSPLEIRTLSPLSIANAGVPYAGVIEVTSGTAPYTWTVVGGELPDGLLLAPATGHVTGRPRQPGTNEFTVRVQDASPARQTATRTFTLAVRDLSESYNQALELNDKAWNYWGGYPWNEWGNVLWQCQTNVTHDGVDAAESGAITANQLTWMETTFEGPGILTFWWKVSSEQGVDFLRVLIDGNGADAISGEVEWKKGYALLHAGPQAVRWSYRKASFGAVGQNRAWVDQVEVIPSLAPLMVSQPQHQTIVAGDSTMISAAAFGASPLSYQWFHNGRALPACNRSSFDLLSVQSAQAGAYSLVVSNPYGSITSQVATLTVESGLSLAEALDVPQFIFVNRGNVPWVAQTTTTYDGVDAVESGPITNWPGSQIETTVAGPGRLSFWWKLSTATGTNYLHLATNEVFSGASITGNTDWQPCALEIAPGVQTLSWIASRDGGGSSTAQDLAWLDSVEFVPAPLPPTILQYPQSLSIPAGSVARFGVTARGPEPMFWQWRREGLPIDGASSSQYAITNAQWAQAGRYDVVISNAYGMVTSGPALLQVIPSRSVITSAVACVEAVLIPRWGSAAPYPSALQISGLPGVIQKVTATVSALSHPCPTDLSLLLVSPSGEAVMLMSAALPPYPPLDSATFTFDDDAPATFDTEEQIISGVYRPAGVCDYPMPEPAPSSPYRTNLLAFAGSNPNGTWRLFVYDDDDGRDKAKSGSLLEGWSLSIITGLPTILNPVVEDGQFHFQLHTGKDKSYSVEYTDSLSTPSWQTLQTITGDGTIQGVTNICSAAIGRFYRVREQP